MRYTIKRLYNNELKSNYSKCFGLCCTALFFSVCDGFPQNKEADKPFINLKDDFKCKVHNNLRKKARSSHTKPRSKSIFLTQVQINSARINSKTQLLPMITRLSYWK